MSRPRAGHTDRPKAEIALGEVEAFSHIRHCGTTVSARAPAGAFWGLDWMWINSTVGLACPYVLSPMCRSCLLTKKATNADSSKRAKRRHFHDGDAMYRQVECMTMLVSIPLSPINVAIDVRAESVVHGEVHATKRFSGGWNASGTKGTVAPCCTHVHACLRVHWTLMDSVVCLVGLCTSSPSWCPCISPQTLAQGYRT